MSDHAHTKSIGVYTFAGDITEHMALEFAYALRALPNRDELIRALIVRISSNGGSLGAAESIVESIRILTEELSIPTLSYVCDTALSAGFYIAASVQPCIASNTAILGNAGAAIRRFEVASAFERLGINAVSISSGILKDALFMAQPLTHEARANLESVVQQNADHYVRDISNKRNLTHETVQLLRNGGFFTGAYACRNGLIDETGGFLTAIAKATELSGGQAVDLEDIGPKQTHNAGVLKHFSDAVQGLA